MIPKTVILVRDIDEPVCDTCKSQIEFLPYREVRIRDKNSDIKNLHYHFFSPCWDLGNFFVMNEECRILSIGFTFDEKILVEPSVQRNFEKNLDLWT